MLEQLRQRKTFTEEYGADSAEGVRRGKLRILELERIRPGTTTLDSILSEDPELQAWYRRIDT
jgi:hypothetical protein